MSRSFNKYPSIDTGYQVQKHAKRSEMKPNTGTSWNRYTVAGAIASCFAIEAIARDLPSREAMWAIIQQQQEEIEALKRRVGFAEETLINTQTAVEETSKQIEATASYVETITPSISGSGAAPARYGNTHIGGYGELHYNFGKTDKADFHRWVLFLEHEFNETVRMFSEVELEHSIAGEGKTGEIELEQAYIEFDLNEADRLKAGLFLMPIGILNETHEPTTFYGVERNQVESAIIPSTWWEGGLAYTHRDYSGWSFDAAVHTGLKASTAGDNAFRIRRGRQKVGNAEASDGAITTRARYTGVPGLELALSAQYQADLAQGGFAETIDATLFAAHVDYESGPFGFRALAAQWNLGGDTPSLTGADKQYGYYLEPSYRIEAESGDFGLFARYSYYDTAAGDATSSGNAFFDIGMNYWPLDNVVLKWDIQFTDYADSARDEEIINLGIGYDF